MHLGHEHSMGCDHAHTHEHTHSHEHTHDGVAHTHEHSHAHEHNHEHKHGESCSHGHTPQNPHLSSPNPHLSIPLAVQKVMGLRTVHAEMRRIASTISFAGRYELNPDARQKIATPVSGRLTLHVKALAHVKKGQAIFSVYSHTGYAIATDADYDGARMALTVVS